MPKKSSHKIEVHRIQRASRMQIPRDQRAGPVFYEGKGAIVRDVDGKEYIDCNAANGVVSIGHCHPELIRAIKTQLERLITSPLVYTWNLPVIELIEELNTIVPQPLKRFCFCNSGAEAVEGAVKLSKKYSFIKGRSGAYVISLENSFHGQLGLSSTLTGQSRFKKNLGACIYPGVLHVPAPYCYRCDLEYPDCGIYCAGTIEAIINACGKENIACMILEPILHSGGIITVPKGYFQLISKSCRDSNINLVLDEVFTGFGRTGRMFACQHWNVQPDMMTVAKGMGGGYPIGAFMSTNEIGLTVERGSHGSTFGGNPLACAAATATIRIIKKEKLAERASEVGSFMMERLERLKDLEHNLVGDVRGQGLVIGIELVKDKKEKTPASLEAATIRGDLLARGVITEVVGQRRNVLKITPPLIITEEQAEMATAAITNCLK